MKTTIITAIVACLLMVGIAPKAEARHPHYQTSIYISGYRSCGTPIYTERRFCGYQRCGTPIWKYRVLSHREYRGQRYGHDRRRDSRYEYRDHRRHNDRYGYRDRGCAPQRVYGHGGIVIRL